MSQHNHDHGNLPPSLLRGDHRFVDLTGPDPRLEGGRWRRLRLAVADHLAEPVAADDHQRARLAGVRAYQRELVARSQAVLRQRVLDGWWLGPAPYGYQRRHDQISDAGTGHPTSGYRLAVDPARAPTVRLIFGWTLHSDLTARQVAGRLAAAPHRHPLPGDPASGQPWPWTPELIRRILTNPAYLGYSVWGRTHHRRRRPQAVWVWSTQQTHPALISSTIFWVVQDRQRLDLHATAHPDRLRVDDEDEHREAA